MKRFFHSPRKASPVFAAVLVTVVLLCSKAGAAGVSASSAGAHGEWESTWLGPLYRHDTTWSYSPSLGWIQMSGTDDSLWIFDQRHGWVWTGEAIFPNLYQPFFGEWWQLGDGDFGERHFYNYWTASWIAEAEGNEAWLEARVGTALQYARRQGVAWLNQVPADQFPDETLSSGAWEPRPITVWVSGFYPAIFWRLYEFTGFPQFRTEAMRRTLMIETQRTRTNTHDLGFIVFLPTLLAMRHSDDPRHEETILIAAQSLASRYSATVGATRSWDWGVFRQGNRFTVIVDNMMNLELLIWASQRHEQLAGYYEMAVTHADTTMREHFREDDSTWHVVVFDERDGSVELKRTWQGYADDSTWSRGQAWAIYGYISMYRLTGEERYLDQALRALDYYMANLPPDGVPYYDFDAPLVNAPARDSSAAAIVASALLELEGLVENGEIYREMAVDMLNMLASPQYLALGHPEQSILRRGSHSHSRQDRGLIYGDYYFLEAIARWMGED